MTRFETHTHIQMHIGVSNYIGKYIINCLLCGGLYLHGQIKMNRLSTEPRYVLHMFSVAIPEYEYEAHIREGRNYHESPKNDGLD